MSRSNRDYAKTSSRLVETIPVFLIALFYCPQSKTFQDVTDSEKDVMVKLNAVPFEAFTDYFQKLFKRFNKCIQVKS
jgi:hypothetical protein